MGDLNAQIGSDNGKYKHIMGPHGVDPPDRNGPLFVEFCNANNMVIGGSLFRHREMEKITWEAPKCYTKKQIDHICISKEWKKYLLFSICPKEKLADIASDHLLVIGEMCLRLENVQRRVKGAVGELFDTNRLSDRNVKNSFVKEVRTRACNGVPSTETVQEQWTAIEDGFITASEKILGVPGTKREEWISDSTWQKIAERKEAKAAIERTKNVIKRIEADRRYEELKREVDIALQSDRHLWFCALAAEGKKKMAAEGDMKHLYEMIRRVKVDEPHAKKPIKSTNGQLLTNPSDQLERWAEHFGQLLAPPARKQRQCADRQPPEPPHVRRIGQVSSEEPTVQEIEAAIQAMECDAEPGIDRISVEMLKVDPTLAAQILHPLFCTIWNTGTFPVDWTQEILVPVPKKEQTDTKICGNWTAVCQLCVGLKVLCKVILNRIQQPIDATLRRQQAAYREGRSALDHIATLRIIIEQMNENAGSLYLVFLQYEKEYNRLSYTYLWSALRRKGVPDKIVNLLAARYNT
ncbi:uncharacterized protein LOC118463450 isoform X1 [Anopheles albimanus]|uniref:uncharacterized protein LOC118463450 isoform X1 n=1 Tax=Anopheles albimanus TaxID=7167 RepID=UPI00164022E6|nr:uncharacterized protein LOC118463450 isoform X1 [Anopheles albimanus]